MFLVNCATKKKKKVHSWKDAINYFCSKFLIRLSQINNLIFGIKTENKFYVHGFSKW